MKRGNYLVRFTRKQMLELGLLYCANCGRQPNNHFRDGLCAFKENSFYKEKVRYGKLVNEKKVKS